MGIDLRDQPRTDEGVHYVTPLPGKSGRVMIVKGIQFDAPLNADTNGDYLLTETRELQGAAMEVKNNEKGDYVELMVKAPEGAPYNGAIVGVFGETVYIPPDGVIQPIVSESTVSFPAGFTFRLMYHAVNAGQTREIYATLRMRHDP